MSGEHYAEARTVVTGKDVTTTWRARVYEPGEFGMPPSVRITKDGKLPIAYSAGCS